MRHFLADCDYAFLARKYGTPLYIYDIDSMQRQYGAIKDAFAGFKSLICYALKANSNLSIIKTLANMGSGADCVSLNEVRRALLAGIPRYKIIFSGVGKEDYEIREALRLGILFINVESEMELLRIERIVKELRAESSHVERGETSMSKNIESNLQDSNIIESRTKKAKNSKDSKIKDSINSKNMESKGEVKNGKNSKNANSRHVELKGETSTSKIIESNNLDSKNTNKNIESISNIQTLQARISIRVNPDVNANTHPYISTGLHENKFGLDIESAKRLYLYAQKSEFLNPVGIHYHIGSQILDSSPLLEATDKIFELAKSLKSANIDLKFFDIGGGFGINYKDDKSFDIANYIAQIIRKIDSLDLTCICEPGRFIMGNSGAILTRVIGEKRTANKRFVIIDCAMNDLIRPSLYHAYHNIVKVDSNPQKMNLSINDETSPFYRHVERKQTSNIESKTANSPTTAVDSTTISPTIAVDTTISSPTLAGGVRGGVKTSKNPNNKKEKLQKCDIVGAICESGDYVAKDREMPECVSGDLLLIESCGAYGFSMSSNYNSRMRPAQVALYKGKDYLIQPRETFETTITPELENLQNFTQSPKDSKIK